MESDYDHETGPYKGKIPQLRCQICGPSIRDPHQAVHNADRMYSLAEHMQKIHNVVMCPSSKGYTDQQLIARRSIKATYTWLNRERDDYGTHRERRINRAGPTMRDAYAEIQKAEMDLDQQAELTPISFIIQYREMYVRPEHPITAKVMTYEGKSKNRLSICSDVLQNWAMGLVHGEEFPLTMDPLHSPDLLFVMPTRNSPFSKSHHMM